MNTAKKESYVQPALEKHELLRDITAGQSVSNGNGKGNNGFGNGGNDGTPNGFQDGTR